MSVARKVLVADDEPSIAMALEFLLARAGYEVRIARNGAEALERVSAERPDLVLLDVMMPALSGYEVCREVKSRHGDAVKIAMLSAKGRDTEVARGLACGADRYIVKPFSPRDLLDAVADLLRDA